MLHFFSIHDFITQVCFPVTKSMGFGPIGQTGAAVLSRVEGEQGPASGPVRIPPQGTVVIPVPRLKREQATKRKESAIKNHVQVSAAIAIVY